MPKRYAVFYAYIYKALGIFTGYFKLDKTVCQPIQKQHSYHLHTKLRGRNFASYRYGRSLKAGYIKIRSAKYERPSVKLKLDIFAAVFKHSETPLNRDFPIAEKLNVRTFYHIGVYIFLG